MNKLKEFMEQEGYREEFIEEVIKIGLGIARELEGEMINE
jgi:hypothetical protein